MIIGVVSDTHDNMPKIKEAVEVFNREGVNLVIHLGDYVSPFSLRPFDKLICPWMGIFGNNDGEKKGLKTFSGGRIKNPPLKIDIAPLSPTFFEVRSGSHKKKSHGSSQIKNKRIVAVHDLATFQRNTKCNVVLYGHSHIPEIRREKRYLMLNPGECGGWLSHKSSVALLNTVNLEPRIIHL
tara:strand:+ start:148 stop:693 length:546 start_codon:yes stop_codon:yes gene_type:complete